MKTDQQIHLLLALGPEAFRFLTGGIELSGPYRGRSVAFKALERRADHVFEPEGGDGPVYLIEIQAQRSGDLYDRLVQEIALYRKTYPGRMVYGLPLLLDASADEPDSPWVGCLGTGPLLRPVYLDGVLQEAERRQPDHPLLAVFLPLRPMIGCCWNKRRWRGDGWRRCTHRTLRCCWMCFCRGCWSGIRAELMRRFYGCCTY